MSKRSAMVPPRDLGVPEFAISQHQIELAADPRVSIRALLGSEPQPQRFVGRPWFVWRDDPDLAREVNERLAPSELN
ncbi:MAG TPA: hypothetical protein VIL42_08690 [Sphingomicrobium sp.]